MPHDAHGKELSVGDRVNLPATVSQIYPGATTCNVVIETIHPAKQTTTLTLTAHHIVREEPEPFAALAALGLEQKQIDEAQQAGFDPATLLELFGKLLPILSEVFRRRKP